MSERGICVCVWCVFYLYAAAAAGFDVKFVLLGERESLISREKGVGVVLCCFFTVRWGKSLAEGCW